MSESAEACPRCLDEPALADDRPPPHARRRRRSPPPENDPAWHERQRRVERYRLRVEAGLGVFCDAPTPERTLDELMAEERAEREAGGMALPEPALDLIARTGAGA